MSLRGRVGRHTHAGGRQCQNWSEDQQTVIALLNRISVSDGGAGGSIAGRIVSGLSSDALYRAISQFEEKHFPGQRSGFVDPGGAMLWRMEELAARAASAPATAPSAPQAAVETPLDILRRNVLDETKAKTFTAGEREAFAPLVTMAVRHIESLKDQGFNKLPWQVELFGRAYVTYRKLPRVSFDGPIIFMDIDTKEDEELPLPAMRYGQPVDYYHDVTTAKLGALLLYNDGNCCRVRPYHDGLIAYLRKVGVPRPIAGADRLGIH